MSNAHHQRLIDAHRSVQAQRIQLLTRMAATRHRLAPGRLTSDIRSEIERQVRATASDVVGEIKAHPLRTTFVGAALLAWVFRKPLLDYSPGWARRAYALLAGYASDTATASTDATDDNDIKAVDRSQP